MSTFFLVFCLLLGAFLLWGGALGVRSIVPTRLQTCVQWCSVGILCVLFMYGVVYSLGKSLQINLFFFQLQIIGNDVIESAYGLFGAMKTYANAHVSSFTYQWFSSLLEEGSKLLGIYLLLRYSSVQSAFQAVLLGALLGGAFGVTEALMLSYGTFVYFGSSAVLDTVVRMLVLFLSHALYASVIAYALIRIRLGALILLDSRKLSHFWQSQYHYILILVLSAVIFFIAPLFTALLPSFGILFGIVCVSFSVAIYWGLHTKSIQQSLIMIAAATWLIISLVHASINVLMQYPNGIGITLIVVIAAGVGYTFVVESTLRTHHSRVYDALFHLKQMHSLKEKSPFLKK